MRLGEVRSAGPLQQVRLINAYEMRNALAHGYFRVDLEILWKTLQNDLPVLHRQIATIMESPNE